jgi:predicted regulator of amino acid metabolism with ACT domain
MIRILGNDIEIDGDKVARILDIRATLLDQLKEYIIKADEYSEVFEKLKCADEDIKILEGKLEDAESG